MSRHNGVLAPDIRTEIHTYAHVCMYICTSSTLPIEAKGSPTGCPSLTPSHTGRKLCYMAAWLRRVACSMMQSIYCCLGEVHDKPKDGKPRYSKVKCMPCVFHIGDSKESGLSCRHGRRRGHARGVGEPSGPPTLQGEGAPPHDTFWPKQPSPETWAPPWGHNKNNTSVKAPFWQSSGHTL